MSFDIETGRVGPKTGASSFKNRRQQVSFDIEAQKEREGRRGTRDPSEPALRGTAGTGRQVEESGLEVSSAGVSAHQLENEVLPRPSVARGGQTGPFQTTGVAGRRQDEENRVNRGRSL